MPYPFWDVGLGYGILMAVIAVIHVFVSHFAIGGGLYLVVAERSARKAGDEDRLEFVRKLSKFFILVTVVFGALTGVMIWFIIGLLNPKATEALIHNFVWGWAIEWTFFIVEILAAILYYYGWKRMSARNHMKLGWIYFAAAWLSLVVINGIITFMLTPGRWLESGAFWDGFFNPTYWPSLVFRTGICLLCAGLFALLVASRYPQGALKTKLVRYNTIWALIGLAVIAVTWFWYRAAIDGAFQAYDKNWSWAVALSRMSIPSMSLVWLQWVSYLLIAALVVLGLLLPRAWKTPVAVVMLLLGLVWFGAFEWFRESARKPYAIYGYMYANGVAVDDIDTYREEGLLEYATFRTDDDGADLFRYACRHCHTLRGYNPVLPAFDHTDEKYVAGTIVHMHEMKGRMPKFPGTPDEAATLAAWLWAKADQAPLKGEGAALGEALYEARCSRCHVLDGFNDKLTKKANWAEEDLRERVLLGVDEELEDIVDYGMPAFTGSEKELDALIEYLKPRLKGGE